MKVYQQKDYSRSTDKSRSYLRKIVRTEESVIQIQTGNSGFEKKPMHTKRNRKFRETEMGKSSVLAVAQWQKSNDNIHERNRKKSIWSQPDQYLQRVQ